MNTSVDIYTLTLINFLILMSIVTALLVGFFVRLSREDSISKRIIDTLKHETITGNHNLLSHLINLDTKIANKLSSALDTEGFVTVFCYQFIVKLHDEDVDTVDKGTGDPLSYVTFNATFYSPLTVEAGEKLREELKEARSLKHLPSIEEAMYVGQFNTRKPKT